MVTKYFIGPDAVYRALPFPNGDLSTWVSAPTSVPVPGQPGLHAIVLDPQLSSKWVIFSGVVTPVNWNDYFGLIDLGLTSDSFLPSAIAKINQFRK